MHRVPCGNACKRMQTAPDLCRKGSRVELGFYREMYGKFTGSGAMCSVSNLKMWRPVPRCKCSATAALLNTRLVQIALH